MSSDSDFLSPEERRAQRREAKATKAKQIQDDNVIQTVMASSEGRAYIRDLLEFCACFTPVASENPYFTYLNEGKRNVGLRLLADVMRACPDAYVQMMKEQNDGRRDPDPDSESDDAGDDAE